MEATTAPTTAIVTADVTTMDALTTYPAISIKASKLRPGMMVLDDDGFPMVGVIERETAARRSGSACFYGFDVERARNGSFSFHGNLLVPVAAR